MTQLITVQLNELTTTSLIIAQGMEVSHKNTIELIRRYEEDLTLFGEVTFQTRLNPQGSPTEYAILNEPQTTLIISYMKNTEIARAFKKTLVLEFFRMKKALSQTYTHTIEDYDPEAPKPLPVSHLSVTDIGSQIGLSAVKTNKLLESMDYQYRSEEGWYPGWLANPQLVKVETIKGFDNKIVRVLRWHRATVDILRNALEAQELLK